MNKMQGFREKFNLWLQHIANWSKETFATVCSLAALNKLIYVNEEDLTALQQNF
jgi:hypothetical protein